jgi:perosamine synthetase
MKSPLTRRHFLQHSAIAATSLAVSAPTFVSRADTAKEKPARLGGKPLCAGFPGWPVFGQPEETALLDTLRSGHWFRGSGKAVSTFEDAYEKLTGAKHCLATASGTAALTTALGALDLGPGDEAILPPYTFVATYNAVVLTYALPVFADIDLPTFQVDPLKMEEAITPETKALLPVHIGGSPADLDRVLATAERHHLPVIEDACQAHLAEWRGRKVGTWGLGGCFSFQASKNLNSGEGGAVLTGDDSFAEACYSFHHQGGARPIPGSGFSYSATRGSNLRLSEFQGNLLIAQMTRVVEQTQRRSDNALYLSELLKKIPGIQPATLYPQATRSAYHLYMFRYDQAQFAGLERSRFLAALSDEGLACSGGYSPLNRSDYVSRLAQNRHFLKIYGEKRLGEWLERARAACPQNEQLCSQAVWFTQNTLLGHREDMDRIAEAIRRIQKSAAELAHA